MKGKPAPRIELSSAQREQLDGFAGSLSLAHSLVVRAKVILLAAESRSNAAIAKEVGLTRETVGKWRMRFVDLGIEGLYDELRSGRRRTIDEERIAQVIRVC